MPHGFIGLPPDGAGKKLHTHETDTGEHNQVFTLGDPNVPDHMQRVDAYGAAYVRGAEGSTQFDSFGKTKVSEETIVGSYIAEYDELPEYFSTTISGGATSTYLSSEKGVLFSCGTTLGDGVKRTSHKYHKYTPGTSQYMLMTLAIGDTGKDGVVRRWGYYDDDNGAFFEMDGTQFNLVIRSNVSGSVVENRIPQSSFNTDKMDGTGLSGLTLDPSKANIYWIDLQWLGVGRVRFGAVSPQGNRFTIHVEENANRYNTIYMGTGSLPIRHEQFNSATTASTSEMKVFNTIVFSESSNLNYRGHCSSTITAFDTPVAITDQWTHLMTLKPNLSYNGSSNRVAFVPLTMSIVATETTQFIITKNATLSGTETYSDVVTNGPMQVSLDGVLVSQGTKVFCGVVPAGVNRLDLNEDFSYFSEYLNIHADGADTDTYTVIARTIGGVISGTAIQGMRWREIPM